PRRGRLHPAHGQEPAQHRLGHHPGPAARRGHREPAGPDLPRAGAVPGARGRLDRAAGLAGLQPRRLRHRVRWRPGRAARAARDPDGRDQAGQETGMTAPGERLVEVPDGLDGERVEALVVIYEDDDIAVIDKPRGVAAHPTPGWSGPTVIGGLTAAGHTVATSGAAERQGIVHRLDANTTGVMVVAKSERAYSALKR